MYAVWISPTIDPTRGMIVAESNDVGWVMQEARKTAAKLLNTQYVLITTVIETDMYIFDDVPIVKLHGQAEG